MGGHAFRYLDCPRLSPEMYLRVRQQATDALRTLFHRVVVPTEMPSKQNYGDVDFLVSGFIYTKPDAPLDWHHMVSEIRKAFNTKYGRRGILNPDCMFFAIPAPDTENSWVQIDVKPCHTNEQKDFDWEHYQLNYASASKLLGSMLKPLGLNINPEGLHIRVEELETTNYPLSLVFVSKDPIDVLNIVGLDRRILHGGFESREAIYEYFASSQVFNPAHFAARLDEDKYRVHLADRSAPWLHFVTEWIEARYPNYCAPGQTTPLEEWRKKMRITLREKVFTLHPSITPEYYTKRAAHLKELEERRLQELLTKAIPDDLEGWNGGFPKPPVIFRDIPPSTPQKATVNGGEVTSLSILPAEDSEVNGAGSKPSPSPPSSTDRSEQLCLSSVTKNPLDTPLYLQRLPRDPPMAFRANPPPRDISLQAKLLCVARWTQFDAVTGAPYLGCEPRDKKFEMCWSDCGVRDEILVSWVQEMWWGIWVRQAWVNYVGMWKRRFEKEDEKGKKQKKDEEAGKALEEKEQRDMEAKRQRILKRLEALAE